MFKNYSIKFQFILSLVLVGGFLVVTAGFGWRSSLQTQSSLDHFYSDLFRSMSRLQIIQDIYDGIIRTSVHRLLTQTVEGDEVIDVVDEGIAAAEVHWKTYMEI